MIYVIWSPTPASLPSYPSFPPPHPPLPSPSPPTSLPLEYFSRPHLKKTQVISYNLSFQCIDYYQSFKIGQFVCSSVHLLVCFGVLQPTQRHSRQHCSQAKPCPWRKGKEKGRQDGWEKNCKHSRSRPTLTKTPRHCKLPSTIARPNCQL